MLKKLFSFVSVAALALFAKAEIVQDAFVDFTTMESYDYFKMGVPDGGTRDLVDGSLTIINPATNLANWQFQYFVADGLQLTKGQIYDIEIDLSGTPTGTETKTCNLSFGSWDFANDDNLVIPEGRGTFKTKVACPDSGVAHICMQTGSYAGTIKVYSVKVSHDTECTPALNALGATNIEAKANAWDNQVYFQIQNPLQTGKEYEISVDIYGDKDAHFPIWANDTVQIAEPYPHNNCQYVVGGDFFVRENKWTTTKHTFTAQYDLDKFNFTFGTDDEYTGTCLYFDNVVLTEKGSDVNLLDNSDFADGRMKQWHKGWMHSFDLKIATAPAHPGPATIYCDNTIFNWDKVYAYVRDAEVNINNAPWPGVEMTKGEGNLWSYTFPNFEPTNVIFNNGDGKKTADLVFEDGKTYRSSLYLRGDMNEWGTTNTFNTLDNAIYTISGVNITKEQGFKIANEYWTLVYTCNEPLKFDTVYTLTTDLSAPNMKLAEDMVNGSIVFNLLTGTATFLQGEPAGTKQVTDVLTYDNTTKTITGNSYDDIKNVIISSDAVYYLNAFNTYSSIQIRSKTNDSGIVTTTSGGKVKKVTVTFNEKTNVGNVLDIYAKNTKYASPTDLYSTVKATSGKKEGSIAYESGTATYTFDEFDADSVYEYIGLRSNSGALYLDTIKIEWETAGDVAVSRPQFTPASGDVNPGDKVYVYTTTPGAEVYYTIDGEEPTAESTKYIEPIEIYSNTTIKAVAVANGVSSSVAIAKYTPVYDLEGLSPLMDMENGTKFVVNDSLTVAYASGPYAYVYDGTYYGLIYQFDNGLKTNDVIAGGWTGVLDIYKGLYEIKPTAKLTTVADAQPKAFRPVPVDAEDEEMTLAPNHMNQYLTLQNVVFDAPTLGAKKEFTGKMGEYEVNFKNVFGIDSVAAGRYNVPGFVAVTEKINVPETTDDADATDTPAKPDTVTVVEFYPVSYAVPSFVCENIAALDSLTEEQAMDVRLTLTEAKVTYYAENAGVCFVEDTTGATRIELSGDAVVNGLVQGKAVTGYAIGVYAEGALHSFATEVVITDSKDVNVEFGAELTLAQAKEAKNASKLVTFVASDSLTIVNEEGALMISSGELKMPVYDLYHSLPEDYVYPDSVVKITGVINAQGMVALVPRSEADIVAAPVPAVELYFRSSLDNWGAGLKFESTDNVTYTLTVNQEIPVNTEFKIANADWTVSYTYTEKAIVPNVEYTFVDGKGMDNNTKFAEGVKSGAKLTFNSETKVFKVEGTSGIDALDADTNVVYYNMQGVRLNAPVVGQPCIRVANGTATKVIVK